MSLRKFEKTKFAKRIADDFGRGNKPSAIICFIQSCLLFGKVFSYVFSIQQSTSKNAYKTVDLLILISMQIFLWNFIFKRNISRDHLRDEEKQIFDLIYHLSNDFCQMFAGIEIGNIARYPKETR